jgi:hypothetical protein
MEIGEIKPTAELEYMIKAADKDGNELPPQPLKLTVRFMGIDRGVDVVKLTAADDPVSKLQISDFNHAAIASAIIAWDLNTSGVPIPVNDETKKLYVPHICAARTEDGEIVGYDLIGFILDSRNFLKNS